MHVNARIMVLYICVHAYNYACMHVYGNLCVYERMFMYLSMNISV